jgi:nitrite reductase (NADH) small subunit
MEVEVLTHTKWFLACSATDVPENGGACVKYQDEQIAIFNFSRRKEWYATFVRTNSKWCFRVG